MTRITSNLDLVRLVQQQLNKVARAKRNRTSKVKSGSNSSQPQGLAAVQKLAEVGSYSDDELKRALVQGLLAEEFGEGLINDSQFQQVVDKVTKLISQNPETDALLRDSISQLAARK